MTKLSLNHQADSRFFLYVFSALTIFVNPLMEAPKNMAMALMLLAMIYHTVRRGGDKSWSRWESFFVLFVLSYVVALPFSAYHTATKSLTDVARYILFGLVIYRAGFNEQQKRGLVFWAVLGNTVGLIYGAWDHFYLKHGDFWTLNSVGHVNHAAIYNAIICGMALTMVFAYWSVLNFGKRLVWIGMLALSLVYVAFGESRATFGAMMAVVALLSLGFSRKDRRFLALPVVFIAGVISLAVLTDARVVTKQEQNTQAHNILSDRDVIWHAAAEQIRQHPLFGLGKENFRQVSIVWPNGITGHASHAHNIYINVLTEGGIWAFLWVFGLFGAVGITLVRYWPRKDAQTVSWLSWGAACSALGVTLIVGLVNTPFHHEHGNLTMLCFALWLSQYRQDRLLSRKAISE